MLCAIIFYLLYFSFESSTSNQNNVNYLNKNPICIVLTSEKSILTRGVAVWETWGQGI